VVDTGRLQPWKKDTVRHLLAPSLALGLALLITTTAAAGSTSATQGPRPGTLIGSPTREGTLTTAQLDALTAKAGTQALAGAARCDVTTYQVNYTTPGVQAGQMSNASAAVLVPGGPSCPGPFPLIAWARGTQVAKAYTNANPNDPVAQQLMEFFAAQGYAVVATDYLGYALSAYPYHPYMHAATEASAVIDSIRAARAAAGGLGLKLNGKVMLSGYSQGGHAAMAAQRAIEAGTGGEFDLVAAAELAGPYNVSGALVKGAKNPILGVQVFVPFQVTAFQKIYGNVYSKATDVFNAPYASYVAGLLPSTDVAALATKLPAGTPRQAQKAMFTAAYIKDLASNPKNATTVAAVKQNQLNWNPQGPTRMCGSSDDPTVSFATNAQTAYKGFRSRSLTNVSLVDVAPRVRKAFASVLESSPATFQANYHGSYEPPFCMAVARHFFDEHQ
jgi:pimeloyl-ACP methyl ester carboxylesterase